MTEDNDPSALDTGPFNIDALFPSLTWNWQSIFNNLCRTHIFLLVVWLWTCLDTLWGQWTDIYSLTNHRQQQNCEVNEERRLCEGSLKGKSTVWCFEVMDWFSCQTNDKGGTKKTTEKEVMIAGFDPIWPIGFIVFHNMWLQWIVNSVNNIRGGGDLNYSVRGRVSSSRRVSGHLWTFIWRCPTQNITVFIQDLYANMEFLKRPEIWETFCYSPENEY